MLDALSQNLVIPNLLSEVSSITRNDAYLYKNVFYKSCNVISTITRYNYLLLKGKKYSTTKKQKIAKYASTLEFPAILL